MDKILKELEEAKRAVEEAKRKQNQALKEVDMQRLKKAIDMQSSR
jgi:hypothetical protein